ncbi:MAG: PIG-L family deacetylase [Candidatus Latescibacterota bacterium]
MKSRFFNKDMKALDVAMIVVHPDDETLWAGGLILSRPAWKWTIVALCRKSDPDRAPKFVRVLERFGASGKMADLDDGPEQAPLPLAEVQNTVLQLLAERRYDVIITHSPFGEYTRHRRHEETGRAVGELWITGTVTARELWLFAYDDDGAERLPEAIDCAHLTLCLAEKTHQVKYDTIVNLYGFAADSWEARVTPEREAFWCYSDTHDYQKWLASEGKRK